MSLSVNDAHDQATPSSSLLRKPLGASGGSPRARNASETPLNMTSALTCPNCGHVSRETMRTDACIYFYDCAGCGALPRPKAGECCVFCSYGSVLCSPVQAICYSIATHMGMPAHSGGVRLSRGGHLKSPDLYCSLRTGKSECLCG